MFSSKQISFMVKILLIGIIIYISRMYPRLFKPMIVADVRHRTVKHTT